MEQAVLTSNLKKIPKKVVKELLDDLLVLFPDTPEGDKAPPPHLLTAWMKLYQSVKQTYPADNVGFIIPCSSDEGISLTLDLDTASWYKEDSVKIRIDNTPDDEANNLPEFSHTCKLSRSACLNLLTFAATAIAHLPNE